MNNFFLLNLLLIFSLIATGCVSVHGFNLNKETKIFKKEIVGYNSVEDNFRKVELVIYEPHIQNINKPALIMVSGCDGGHFNVHKAVAEYFLNRGVVIAVVESIKAYGNQCNHPRLRLSGRDRAGHVFVARDLLIANNIASPDNVGLIGLSHGGWTAVHASKLDMPLKVRETILNQNPLSFAVALYPFCSLTETPGRHSLNPLLIFGSLEDEWTPLRFCSLILSNDPKINIHTYPKGTHGWDAPFPDRTVQTTSGPHFLSFDKKITEDSINRTIDFIKNNLRL